MRSLGCLVAIALGFALCVTCSLRSDLERAFQLSALRQQREPVPCPTGLDWCRDPEQTAPRPAATD
jgi:hypothetical protein